MTTPPTESIEWEENSAQLTAIGQTDVAEIVTTSSTWDINSKPFEAEDGQNIRFTPSTEGEREMGASSAWGGMWADIEAENDSCKQPNEEDAFDFEGETGQENDRMSMMDLKAGSERNLRRKTGRSSIWKFQEYELPQSTYTLLITSDVLSLPYLIGILAGLLSISSLVIVLLNVTGNDTLYSHLGIPGGVTTPVVIAQILGVIVGVLMEEEIPTGLEIMGKCLEQGMLGRYPFKTYKVVISCLLRLAVGYMYLASLFLTVIQNTDVLDIFFDVLALEFVERLDDVIYVLLKRGFFGKRLRVESHAPHSYLPPGDEASNTFSKRVKIFIRVGYFFNAIFMIIMVCYIAFRQKEGDFRCKSILIAIEDNVWEESWVQVDGGDPEKRLLIYSHFNGIYKENGTHHGYPKYTEQNKEGHTGEAYQHTIGAEIIYCRDLNTWVFRHELIRTSPFDDDEENKCSWLLRSPETDSFDIIEVAQEGWDVWTGQIGSSAMSITCNECYSNADCNHHGGCNTDKHECKCQQEYFGIHCEYRTPCEVIRSVKDDNATLHLLHDSEDVEDHFVEVYGHPKYEMNMQGIPTGLMRLESTNDDTYSDDDFFEIHNEMESFQKFLMNYTFTLRYTGRRWYGQITPLGLTAKSFDENEYHAFWDNAFSGLGVDDNATVIISAPSTDASPVGVDFYEMRRRNKKFEDGGHNYNYGPFGVLLDLVGAEGAGYFHCNEDEYALLH